MPSFRHCCRYPRASSPGLPNVQPIPSPTQDEGYDADAVRISTPVEIMIDRLHPSPDEPRRSCDTIVHHEAIERSSHKVRNDGEGGDRQTTSEAPRVQRVSSIHIPRRRSHTRSQPVPSSSLAALEHYVKISPSQSALRKRLEAVKIIDQSETPLSPKFEPTRIINIQEASIPTHRRVLPNENRSSFCRPVLREVNTNEFNEEAMSADRSNYALTGQRVKVAKSQPDDDPSCNTENEHNINYEAPIPISSEIGQHHYEHYRNFLQKTAKNMPGSCRSESTDVSIHLHDMQISERVASSNSNIVAMGDLNARHQHSSTTGSHPYLPSESSLYRRSRKSSSLQSPKESSSIYSSNEDELASSRRSSILLIQSIPERIQRLKSYATSGDLYSTSAHHSEITVIPRSRFPTTFTDDPQQQQAVGNKTCENEADFGDNAGETKLRSPSLRRWSTEPRLNRFKRGTPASFDGSGEWHLSPPTHQLTGLKPRRPSGLLIAQSGNFLSPEDPASIWERALREHAQEDDAISRARVGSISYEIGRDDLKRRARSRRFTRTPSPLQEITEDPWSQMRGQKQEMASVKGSPAQATPGTESSTAWLSRADRLDNPTSTNKDLNSTKPVGSWARYPSHTFSERTEAASAEDNVISRDFAIGLKPQQKTSKKSRSMTFGRRFLHKVGRLYKTRSSDFRRYNAGHRSSISVGGVLEYPELEIPRPSFEPVLLSGPRDVETENTVAREAALREAIKTSIPSPPLHTPTQEPPSKVGSPGPELNAVEWQKIYGGCVVRPRNTSTDEEIAPDDVSYNNASTLKLDEAQQAEVDEAKDAALKAAEDCLRRSMELVRYPKRLNCP
ncbi:MAG: hypothetical protein Q9219_000198 [cf. Caloplaca sp. 3 TL-2023]